VRSPAPIAPASSFCKSRALWILLLPVIWPRSNSAMFAQRLCATTQSAPADLNRKARQRGTNRHDE
jgi:hypothetical protein